MQNKQSSENKVVILSVTNDLITEQRVHKVAMSLLKMGYLPVIVGRVLKNSAKLKVRAYPTRRFWLPFENGLLFYASYNIRLLFFLLFHKCNIIVSNDLDTLLANYLAYKIKRFLGNKSLKLIYDSHEIYTEVPELNGRNKVKKIWLAIEKWIVPKIQNAYTVCQPIADFYKHKYNINMQVISNMPLTIINWPQLKTIDPKVFERKKIILYQGALNMGRGIEQVINCMHRIENALFVVAGNGNLEVKLKKLVSEKHLGEKVIFTGILPLEELPALTKIADIGLVLQEDLSLSYHFVLPNRLFGFIQAQVPMLASELPEIKQIVEKEKVGLTIKGFDENELVEKINELLYNQELIKEIKANMSKARLKYCWEKEEDKIFNIYTNC